eukprot:5662440-Pyramimonas_sp.AAC.1
MGYPVIIGGDFNMIPSVVVQSHLGDSLGQWMIPGDTTCNSVAGPKVYDDFFVSPGLSKGVARVSVRQGSDLSPHSPVHLTLHPLL